MDRITCLFGTGRAISFPAGKPPVGSCEFATATCLRECADRNRPFISECKTYSLFKSLTSEQLSEIIKGEAKRSVYSPIKVLSWFPESGDCPAILTNKVAEVMRSLLVAQNGFTRNKELWRLSQGIPDVTLVLTIENEAAASRLAKGGLVGIPNYQEEKVKIIGPGETWLCGGGTVCGCGTVEHEESESEEDCGLCHLMSRGCFAKVA